jgi:hypothetical protein
MYMYVEMYAFCSVIERPEFFWSFADKDFIFIHMYVHMYVHSKVVV